MSVPFLNPSQFAMDGFLAQQREKGTTEFLVVNYRNI